MPVKYQENDVYEIERGGAGIGRLVPCHEVLGGMESARRRSYQNWGHPGGSECDGTRRGLCECEHSQTAHITLPWGFHCNQA